MLWLGCAQPQHISHIFLWLTLFSGQPSILAIRGLAQIWDYMDKCGAEEGHLIIFDRTPGKPWEEKLFRQEERYQGRAITVWGM